MPGFVILYNRRNGDYSVREFLGEEGHRAAMDERLRAEAVNSDPNVEIVSLNGHSLESVQQTHSRYFKGRELAAA